MSEGTMEAALDRIIANLDGENEDGNIFPVAALHNAREARAALRSRGSTDTRLTEALALAAYIDKWMPDLPRGTTLTKEHEYTLRHAKDWAQHVIAAARADAPQKDSP